MNKQPKKIHIVDDNSAILDSLEILLKMEGYEVKKFEKGSELLHNLKLNQSFPDAVLMDVFINDEDGRDFCRLIKADNHLKIIPVLIMSANNGLSNSAFENGADDFISKKEIANTKNKISYQRINEELNIYYVAATRAKNVVQLADLNLTYTYNENDDSSSFVKSRFINKKADNKKSKELQEEWLKKNRVKKVNAF